MKGIRVDPARRTARPEPGVPWAGGGVSTTGAAGLTLGGGIGWLGRTRGLSCDNLLSADIVTADGKLRTATADENADLFWALRGGARLPSSIFAHPGSYAGITDLLKQAQHIQFGPLSHDAAVPHPEHVDPAQLDRPTGCWNAREVTPVDAPPGDPIGNNVALRHLIVDLVVAAGHPFGDATHETLEAGAVHGRLARHIRHKVSCEDCGAVLGCVMVVADGAAHKRFGRAQ